MAPGHNQQWWFPKVGAIDTFKTNLSRRWKRAVWLGWMYRLDKGIDKDNKGVSALGNWVYITVLVMKQGLIGITLVDRVDAVWGVVLGYACFMELLAPRSRNL